MKDELIKLETAKLAKEKGFVLYTEYYYSKKYKSHLEKGWEYKNGYGAKEWNWNREDLQPYPIKDVLCSAPTQSLLAQWLREKNKIYINISPCFYIDKRVVFQVYYSKIDDYNLINCCIREEIENEYPREFETYEEALEAGINEGLKLI